MSELSLISMACCGPTPIQVVTFAEEGVRGCDHCAAVADHLRGCWLSANGDATSDAPMTYTMMSCQDRFMAHLPEGKSGHLL